MQPRSRTQRRALIQQLGKQADRLAQLATGRRAEGWRLTGIDPEGVDLRREGAVARIEFPSPVATAEALDGDGRRPAAGGDGTPKKVTVR